MNNLVLLALASSVLVLIVATAYGREAGLDAERVAQVAQMLPETPAGPGRPASDRAAWERLAGTEAFKQVVQRAEKLLSAPIPDQPDELYLDFSRTGNRRRWERVAFQRRHRLAPLVLAECIEGKGRFIPAIEKLVDALCAERTWVMPAHDRSLANFQGRRIDIDLASSALGWNLALTEYLLGDRLSPKARQQIRENVMRRIVEPYRQMYSGMREPNWWMRCTNNWNAVCLAGVTGAGLALLPSRQERAEFVVAAEKYSRNFLRGFTSDGYCSEGLGYWNYGFGHYVLLAETVRQATGGGVDLLARPEVRAPATFPARIAIIGNVYPAFADCSINTRPAPDIMFFLNRVLGLGLKEYAELDLSWVVGNLPEALIFAFPNAATQAPPPQAKAGPGLRSWFDKAGVLIGRPKPGSQCQLGVALKGGHNAEHHNHNDVGSYVVVVKDKAVLLDPGRETYTARTFSSRRYESKLLNSFGHPVPVVAGKLQRPGKDARAVVVRTEFTDAEDTLVLDISRAYDVPELRKLQRTFIYSRKGTGALVVTDEVEFSSPQTFETALITLGGFLKLEDGALAVYDGNRAVRVEIDTGGLDYTIAAEEIREDAPVTPTRIGIRINAPIASATVRLTITPLEKLAEDSAGGLLRNGGFEVGTFCWELPRGCMGQISQERAASGRWSLKITDASTTAGSNISSSPVKVEGAGRYVLRGKVFFASGKGIGLYVKMFDARGRLLNPTDKRGWISPIASLYGKQGRWISFEVPFETLPETAVIQLWIHSYNASRVTAYLDDLSIVSAESPSVHK